MYPKIKQLADDALALQNKVAMEAALREISELCGAVDADKSGTGMTADQFEAAELAQHQTRNLTATELLAHNAASFATSAAELDKPRQDAENAQLRAMLDATTAAAVKDGKGGEVKIARVKTAKDKPARGKKK